MCTCLLACVGEEMWQCERFYQNDWSMLTGAREMDNITNRNKTRVEMANVCVLLKRDTRTDARIWLHALTRIFVSKRKWIPNPRTGQRHNELWNDG